MATVVLADPDTAKAAVSEPGAMVHLTFPIEKRQDTDTVNPLDGTPDILIWGKATDATLDSDLQIVDPDWSLKALREWFDTKANVRMQHDPKQPVGKGVDVDGHYVKSLICDPKAKYFIRNGVLNDYSIGIANPDVRSNREPRWRSLDPQGKAVKGIITGHADGSSKIAELTVCDRGANYGSSFAIAKAAADGSMMLVDELTVPDAPADSGLTAVELPSDMKLKVTPAVLAKMATLKRDLVLREQAMKADSAQFIAKADLKDSERAGMPAGDFAYVDSEGGKHLPVHDEGHVRSALGRFAQQHFDSPAAKRKAARKIVSRARSMGIDLADHGTVIAAAGKLAGTGAAKAAGDCAVCKGRGYVKPDKNVKCDACGGSGRATGKTALPVVVKCGTCSGSGMSGGKPCPDCDDGKEKAAAAEVAKKHKVMCGNCGAKQNIKHGYCPECGNKLIPLPIRKNHDFNCLGCNKELDKGEKFCPDCGKANPGYLPEADHKIPANAGKAAKERVSKKAKKGKKDKMPFGGKQNPPFGADKDKDGDDDTAAKSAVVKGKKKGGKGRSPAAGVKGHATEGLPAHLDGGAQLDVMEDDTQVKAAAADPVMATALRHKASGLPPELAALHDLTCPAFSPSDVAKALPGASFAGIDTRYWSDAAVKAASGGDVLAARQAWQEAQAVSAAAVTLKTAEPQALHRVRLAAHDAFLEANKAFRDATPGPGSAPTPGHIQPGSFRRPYIQAGHGAESPQSTGMRDFPVITGHPQAMDYQRGYLSAGHASESPGNGPQHHPVPEGSGGAQRSVAGDAASMQSRDYAQAVSTMHDHLARIAPGMCAMSPPVGDGQKPAPHVPAPVGMVDPHSAKAAKPTRADKAAARAKAKARAAQAKARKAKKAAREQRRFDKAVTAAVTKATAPAEPQDAQQQDVPFAQYPEIFAAALRDAVKPLAGKVRDQGKVIRKQAKMIDRIAGQPDTTGAPFRGAGGTLSKSSATVAPPRTPADAAAAAQTGEMMRLHQEYRGSWNPADREAARREYTKRLGINPVTSTDTDMHPFRT